MGPAHLFYWFSVFGFWKRPDIAIAKSFFRLIIVIVKTQRAVPLGHRRARQAVPLQNEIILLAIAINQVTIKDDISSNAASRRQTNLGGTGVSPVQVHCGGKVRGEGKNVEQPSKGCALVAQAFQPVHERARARAPHFL